MQSAAQNVTDIDDDVLRKAKSGGVAKIGAFWQPLTAHFI